jgi:hypothetical protein
VMTFDPFSNPSPQVWQPSDNGYLVANGDPMGMVGTSVLIAGTVYLSKMKARTPLSISAVRFSVNLAGVGASTGSFAGLYSSAGVLLSGSADIGALLLSTGDLNVPLSNPGRGIAAGDFAWVALLVNLATTQPTINRFTGAPGTGANLGLTPTGYESCINGTGLTALPGSITPSANSLAGAIAMCAGAS